MAKDDSADVFGEDDESPAAGGNIAEMLKGYAERAANILDEQDALKEDLKELHKEVKNAGLDMAAFRQVVKLKREGSVGEYAKKLAVEIDYLGHLNLDDEIRRLLITG